MKKIFKKIACSLFLFLGINQVLAQSASTSNDALGRITITSYLPEQTEAIPDGAAIMLSNKLDQIITSNGIAGSGYNSRFIFVPSIVVLSKELLATAPSMIALALDVNLYIGDGIEGKRYLSKTVTVRGVGTNETKAYIDAIKNIKVNDPSIQSFMASGKSKIINYYNARCNQIIAEAQAISSTQYRYEEAIFKLISIPEECAECYNKASVIIAQIFKKKIERDCKIIMIAANNLWSANQSWETANEVGLILNSIDPDASCYKEAKTLSEKIGKRIIELDDREWKYKMDLNVNLERDRIKAIRDVGVAFGNGQPKNVIYKSIW
jgi:hypothetical protein